MMPLSLHQLSLHVHQLPVRIAADIPVLPHLLSNRVEFAVVLAYVGVAISARRHNRRQTAAAAKQRDR